MKKIIGVFVIGIIFVCCDYSYSADRAYNFLLHGDLEEAFKTDKITKQAYENRKKSQEETERILIERSCNKHDTYIPKYHGDLEEAFKTGKISKSAYTREKTLIRLSSLPDTYYDPKKHGDLDNAFKTGKINESVYEIQNFHRIRKRCLAEEKKKQKFQLELKKIYDYSELLCEGFAKTRINGKYGFVNKNGYEICEFKYADCRSFKNGFAYIKVRKNKCGFIDTTGMEICELKYSKCKDFEEGYAAVKLRGKWGFIDVLGVEICKLKYDDCEDFYHGCARVSIKGRWGLIDATGKEICKIKYKHIEPFDDSGFAKVMIIRGYRDCEWLKINRNGEEFALSGEKIKRKKKSIFDLLG